MSGANGVIDHLGGASVEAMDTSDASNPLSSTTSRTTSKSSTTNKPQSNKPINPGRKVSVFIMDLNKYDYLLVNTGLPQ